MTQEEWDNVVDNADRGPVMVWPWFRTDAPWFEPRKLTRSPNYCYCCGTPMVDFGETQIVYSCINLACRNESAQQDRLDMLCCEFPEEK